MVGLFMLKFYRKGCVREPFVECRQRRVVISSSRGQKAITLKVSFKGDFLCSATLMTSLQNRDLSYWETAFVAEIASRTFLFILGFGWANHIRQKDTRLLGENATCGTFIFIIGERGATTRPKDNREA